MPPLAELLLQAPNHPIRMALVEYPLPQQVIFLSDW